MSLTEEVHATHCEDLDTHHPNMFKDFIVKCVGFVRNYTMIGIEYEIFPSDTIKDLEEFEAIMQGLKNHDDLESYKANSDSSIVKSTINQLMAIQNSTAEDSDKNSMQNCVKTLLITHATTEHKFMGCIKMFMSLLSGIMTMVESRSMSEKEIDDTNNEIESHRSKAEYYVGHLNNIRDGKVVCSSFQKESNDDNGLIELCTDCSNFKHDHKACNHYVKDTRKGCYFNCATCNMDSYDHVKCDNFTTIYPPSKKYSSSRSSDLCSGCGFDRCDHETRLKKSGVNHCSTFENDGYGGCKHCIFSGTKHTAIADCSFEESMARMKDTMECEKLRKELSDYGPKLTRYTELKRKLDEWSKEMAENGSTKIINDIKRIDKIHEENEDIKLSADDLAKECADTLEKLSTSIGDLIKTF